MRDIYLVLALFIALALASCNKQINGTRLQIRDGLAYEVNSEKPFSGTVTGQLDDSLKYEVNYLDGIKHGYYLEYRNEKENKYTEGEYYNGQKDGTWSVWLSSGQKRHEKSYDKGSLQSWKGWTNNGIKAFEGAFTNKKYGVMSDFNEKGEVIQKNFLAKNDEDVFEFLVESFMISENDLNYKLEPFKGRILKRSKHKFEYNFVTEQNFYALVALSDIFVNKINYIYFAARDKSTLSGATAFLIKSGFSTKSIANEVQTLKHNEKNIYAFINNFSSDAEFTIILMDNEKPEVPVELVL